MFCEPGDLQSESDVEQKLLWPLLTQAPPIGMGYAPSEIATKHDIRRYEIDRGAKKRLYYPDYIALVAGFPAMIVEAKAPGESMADALEEARLYAAKLNESFPTGINPCVRILACNGEMLATTPSDSSTIDLELPFNRIVQSDTEYARLHGLICRTTLRDRLRHLVHHLTKRPLRKPVALLGGQSVRNEEIGHNTFGANLRLDFRYSKRAVTPLRSTTRSKVLGLLGRGIGPDTRGSMVGEVPGGPAFGHRSTEAVVVVPQETREHFGTVENTGALGRAQIRGPRPAMGSTPRRWPGSLDDEVTVADRIAAGVPLGCRRSRQTRESSENGAGKQDGSGCRVVEDT